VSERPTLTVSQYTANALPAHARDADFWTWDVHARLTRNGRWIVTTGHEYYDADGNPHGTAHEAGDHTRADAIDLAAKVACTMRVMNLTAAEYAARVAAARAAR
jgi:hypothetical protein